MKQNPGIRIGNEEHEELPRVDSREDREQEQTVRCTGRTKSLTTTIIKNVDSGVVCVRSRGWGVRPIDQAGISVGVITQEWPPGCGQPRIPVLVFGVEIDRY
jgi:hypothetical protein